MPNTIQESIKTQLHFSQGSINNTTPVSILPSTNTALKQSLQTKYPTAVISSYLEIRLLDLSVMIDSITEYELPDSVIKGEISPVGQNRDLVRSLWDNPRKQLNVYHKFGNGTIRPRGSVSLLNKGSVNSYYLENLMGILTTEATYPVSANEDILIGLFDAGFGLLLAADEILFTGVFTHYITVTNDAYLANNGSVIELATFDQLQSVITNTTNLANAITSIETATASNTTAIDNLETVILELQDTIDSLISASNGSGSGVNLTKDYNPASPLNDLINLLATNNGTVAYSNPHSSKITVSASSLIVGSVALLTDRLDGDVLTADAPNQFMQIDLTTARTVELTGIGLKSRVDIAAHPSSLTIEGSNDGSTFTTINVWSSIGFSAAYEWKYTTFTKSASYRYIRIRQPGVNASGANFLGVSEIALYGTLSAL